MRRNPGDFPGRGFAVVTGRTSSALAGVTVSASEDVETLIGPRQGFPEDAVDGAGVSTVRRQLRLHVEHVHGA